MARAQNDNISHSSYVADVDLSNACALYRFAKAASTQGNVALASGGSNPGPIGVFQETASAGQAIGVKSVGHTHLTGRNAGCNLKIGNYIVCASDGVAQSASAVGDVDGIGWGVWLGPNITTGCAVGDAFLWGTPACILARS